MAEQILSVGIDLGTTTTQMIVSRLQVENMAAPFAVPRMEIQKREILYRGRIHETPLLSPDTLDAAAIERLIAEEYTLANIQPQQIDTGAVIITGETARKENARQVLQALSDFAGDFVVATAGPALESVLAARGAGADRFAREYGSYVLHFDIGGGTSNLALFDPEGTLIDTGCLNVGGRLLKFAPDGSVVYRSPVLEGQDLSDLEKLAEKLAGILEQAAGLQPKSGEFPHFITDKTVQLPQAPLLLSFSGGVADLIGTEEPDWLKYRDLGVLLGRAIRRSRLCQDRYLLGRETIRATVVGAGSHATELSGSTVYVSNLSFPQQNLPVIRLHEPETLPEKLRLYPDQTVALSMEGIRAPTFAQISDLADRIAAVHPDRNRPLVVVLEQDMAKALGQALQLRLGQDAPIACLDGIHAPEGSYLDLAAPLAEGAVIPVVVKTLAFQ